MAKKALSTGKPTFTQDEIQTIGRAANDVWREIGFDILDSVANADTPPGHRRKEIRGTTIQRAHVLELVIDADRLREKLEGRLYRRKDLADRFYNLPSYQAKLRLLKPFFHFDRYGM